MSNMRVIPVTLLTAVASHVTSTRYPHRDGMSTETDAYSHSLHPDSDFSAVLGVIQGNADQIAIGALQRQRISCKRRKRIFRKIQNKELVYNGCLACKKIEAYRIMGRIDS
jgi:hypothetical protein